MFAGERGDDDDDDTSMALSDLPPEILRLILQLITAPAAIARIASTCKMFRAEELWRDVLLSYWVAEWWLPDMHANSSMLRLFLETRRVPKVIEAWRRCIKAGTYKALPPAYTPDPRRYGLHKLPGRYGLLVDVSYHGQVVLAQSTPCFKGMCDFESDGTAVDATSRAQPFRTTANAWRDPRSPFTARLAVQGQGFGFGAPTVTCLGLACGHGVNASNEGAVTWEATYQAFQFQFDLPAKFLPEAVIEEIIAGLWDVNNPDENGNSNGEDTKTIGISAFLYCRCVPLRAAMDVWRIASWSFNAEPILSYENNPQFDYNNSSDQQLHWSDHMGKGFVSEAVAASVRSPTDYGDPSWSLICD